MRHITVFSALLATVVASCANTDTQARRVYSEPVYHLPPGTRLVDERAPSPDNGGRTEPQATGQPNSKGGR